jgi:tripartite-type tricarboxylate transporter receptor subunit TctC
MVIDFSPYSASHSGNNVLREVINHANQMQKDYFFQLDLKPGAQGLIALNETKQNAKSSLSVIHAAFVELIDTNRVNENEWTPVYTVGESCWAVTVLNQTSDIENIKNLNEITVGTVGIGNVTHLTALAIGEKYNIPVRLILFKSNNDALTNLAGNNGVNFVIERHQQVHQLKKINQNVQTVAMSCPYRYIDNSIPTLNELGIAVPGVINLIVAHNDMPASKQQNITRILNAATQVIGKEQFKNLSDMSNPVFKNQTAQAFYTDKFTLLRNLRQRYKNQLVDNRN